jgi:hypothetical protein
MNKLVFLLLICIGLLAIVEIAYGISYVKFIFSVKQDEKDWSQNLQAEREQRSNEYGREAFERLDRIYGAAASKRDGGN